MTAATFPIACILAYVVIGAIYAAWLGLVRLARVFASIYSDALKWRRFCATCGSRAGGQRVLKAAESQEVMNVAVGEIDPVDIPTSRVPTAAGAGRSELAEATAPRGVLAAFAHLTFARRQAD